MLRASNGVVQDSNEFWSAGKPVYDPARITAPTLLVVGEWDRTRLLTWRRTCSRC
jgi:hypothetical protein